MERESRGMVDWHSIDTVLLDMDGTLLDLHFDNYFWRTHLPKQYARAQGLSEQAAKVYLEDLFDANQGSLNWYCLDFWRETLAIDLVALKQEVTDKIVLRPYVTEFLQWLQHLEKTVVMVTNAHRDSLSLKMAHIDLSSHFHLMVSSHDFGSPKEHQTFWHSLKSLHHFDPQTTLLVDDSHAVLRAAQRYGIAHLLSIQQPDSQQAPRQEEPFDSVRCYQQLMNQFKASANSGD